MALDILEIFGDEFTNVTGIKATNDNDEVIIFYHAVDGNNLEYGLTNATSSLAGVGKVDSAIVADATSSIAEVGEADYMIIL